MQNSNIYIENNKNINVDNIKDTKNKNEYKFVSIFKFYLSYSSFSWLFVLLSLTSILVSSGISAFFILKAEIMYNDIFVLISYILVCSLSGFFLSWKLFSDSEKDNTDLFILSKKVSRIKLFLSKYFIIVTMTWINLILFSISLIILMSTIGSKNNNIFQYAFLWLIASFFISLLLISISIFINVFFSSLVSIVSSVFIFASLFTIIILPAFLTKSSKNVLDWDLNKYENNYAKVYKLSDDVDSSEWEYFSYYNPSENDLANKSFQENRNLFNSTDYSFYLDKSLSSIYEMFSYISVNKTQEEYAEIAKKSQYSTILINDFKIENKKSEKSELVYKINHLNPLELDYKNILEYFNNYYLNISNKYDFISILYTQVKNEKYIGNSEIVLKNPSYIKFIREVVGFSDEVKDPLIYYTYRDYSILNKKFKDLFVDMKITKKIPIYFIDLLIKIFRDNNWRKSILPYSQGNILNSEEIKAYFPYLQKKDYSLQATDKDLSNLKSLISEIDTDNKKIKILISPLGSQNKIYSEYDFINFDNTEIIKGVKSKQEWDNLIDNNKILQNAEIIKDELVSWVKSRQDENKNNIDFEFSYNSTESSYLKNRLELKKDFSWRNFIILISINTSILTLLFLISIIKYRIKDIKYN